MCQITKLPIPSCTYGLGARDILSSEPSVFVLKTFKAIVIHEEFLKQYFQLNLITV